jgi:hypothetical protein
MTAMIGKKKTDSKIDSFLNGSGNEIKNEPDRSLSIILKENEDK